MSMSAMLCRDNMTTHSNTLANLIHGVGERVLFVDGKGTLPIAPKEGAFNKLVVYRDLIARIVGRQSPVTREQFAGFYTGRRYATYMRAVSGLAVSPVRPRDAHLKTFVKAEKVNLTIKPNVVPRVIQPRDPRYNVEVGRYLRPVEKKIYHAIDKLFGAPTIMSEYNAYTQAKVIKNKFDRFVDPAVIGLDASRFDQHVSQDALRFEHKLYDTIFRSSELRMLLGWQLVNHGIARATDGWFKYVKKGARMSGDMNTSMGNKVIMCLMAYSYIKSLGVTVDFVNNGDDCLMFVDRRHMSALDGLEAYFADFGFNIKRELPVYELEHIEFCQTKPVCSNGVWRMVRNVKTCLSKDVTCVNLGHNVEEYRRWLKDIGSCGLTTCADVPVLGEFYRMLIRFGLDGAYSNSAEDDYRWYKLSSRNARSVAESPDAYGRYSFWKSTGIVPDEQEELENYFANSIWGGDKRQLIENINLLIKNDE